MKIDCHVHMVGNGGNGSGCWLNLKKPYHKVLAKFMMYSLGLPQASLKGDLEKVYLEQILSWLKNSQIDKLVLLAQEWVRNRQGEPQQQLSSLYVPNTVVLQAAKANPQILAGISIHPARPDAIEELQRCKEQGAVLMKCLPLYQCIDPREPAYLNFWKKMAELKMPLLAHTGGELSLPVNDPELADPRCLIPVLEQGVTVIAAHGGSSSHYFDPNYTEVVGDMLERFPNLYVDNSGMNTPLRSRHFPVLLSERFKERVIHGSDLPIPISGAWARLRGQISFTDYKALYRVQNLIQRDYLIKKALGFTEQSFERLSTLIAF